MSKIVKWGILGLARIAKNKVIPAIKKNENSLLYAVASRDINKINEYEHNSDCVKSYLSYDTLLDDPEVDAVYIPLPNSLHKEWTIKALQRGKHVLCEKPIALNVKECEQMIDTSIKYDRLLMEAFMYRYSDRIKKVNELLKNKAIGEIRQINSTFRFFLNNISDIKLQPELGGGSLYDVGSYPVNFIGMIMNCLPSAYKAVSNNHNDVDTLFSGILRYENGVIATVNSGFNAFREMHSTIIGTDGIIEIPDTFAGDKGEITIVSNERILRINVDDCNLYALEIADFTNAILGISTLSFSLQESLLNMNVIENLLYSLRDR